MISKHSLYDMLFVHFVKDVSWNIWKDTANGYRRRDIQNTLTWGVRPADTLYELVPFDFRPLSPWGKQFPMNYYGRRSPVRTLQRNYLSEFLRLEVKMEQTSLNPLTKKPYNYIHRNTENSKKQNNNQKRKRHHNVRWQSLNWCG